jgi:hypothetical protein
MGAGIRRAVAAVALATTLAGGAAAAPGYLYDCAIEPVESGRGWISPRLALVLPGDGSVTVIDAITMTFSDVPVLGRILRDDARRLIVKWTVTGARTDRGRSFAHFDYRASVSKRSGRIALTAIPRAFDSGVHGTGACARRGG